MRLLGLANDLQAMTDNERDTERNANVREAEIYLDRNEESSRSQAPAVISNTHPVLGKRSIFITSSFAKATENEYYIGRIYGDDRYECAIRTLVSIHVTLSGTRAHSRTWLDHHQSLRPIERSFIRRNYC